jgi:hypothetical protein
MIPKYCRTQEVKSKATSYSEARLIVNENNRVTTTIGITRTIASREQWVTKDNRKMGSKGLRSSTIES